MFEKEIETFEKIIRNNTIGNLPAISLRNILESNISQNVKSYFRGEVEWQLYKERIAESRKSKFDYTHQDIQILQDQIDILLVYNYTFTEKEFSYTLDRCIHFLFNYLCRPQWTLENFLFDEGGEITIQELMIKMRYCSDYGYYGKILEKHFVQKQLPTVSRSIFAPLVQKIDAEIIRQHDATNLSKMTEPFFLFVNYIHQHLYPTDEMQLPTKALMYFFEDKKVGTVVKQLYVTKERGKNSITFAELTSLIKDHFVPQNFTMEEVLSVLKEPSPQSPPPAKHEKRPAIRLPIPERDKLLIMRTLFRDAEEKYLHTIERIVGTENWDDASLQLDHFFTMNDIDPFSREAIIFTNALQTFFSSHNPESGSH